MADTVLKKFDMTGKTAIVTGAAGLLGKQFSLTLAQAGASVVLADLDESLAESQALFLREQGLRAVAVAVDVTDPVSVKAMVKTALEAFGSVDVLVNSAALDPKFDPANLDSQGANAFESYSLESWRQSLDVNLTGTFLATQAAVQPMLAQGKGVIVNICSIYGLNGPDQRIYPEENGQKRFKPVDYSVTKAGLLGFTRYLAAYYAGRNIRVNALTPGGIFNGHDTGFVENYTARAILGRMADLDEVNAAMLFLCSDASSYMTGSNLIIDGGWTAW
ncbi:MAG: SDR family oxidoreductase [Anaerolineaceae bacterium]|jgi:NAD(P)-dependent dehydrogenase (short-subunit alcohol dehydrogenase family)